ncbi:MAG TPA: hypothetical protein PKB10_00235 [Tepidisphaeraceae bacterium]|nr:hypothetical protein [Tepidisphaeraceae bacterium]
MLLLLIVLLGLIFGYIRLTDPDRVRAMAEEYLSDLLGTSVEVERASLSLFEGLRLDGIRVSAGERFGDVLTAGSLLVSYDPAVLLRGRIEATRIVAIDPVVRVTEDRDTGRWSFQSISDGLPDLAPAPAAQADEERRLPLPLLLLRNAQLAYGEIAGGEYTHRGTISIEAQLDPVPNARRYSFRIASRSEREIGPVIEGVLGVGGEMIEASLPRFEIGRDLQAMLPAQVRTWWEEHALVGALRIPRFKLQRGEDGRAQFEVQASVDGAAMAVQPAEWLEPHELRRMNQARRAAQSLRGLGLDRFGLLESGESAARAEPILLHDVSGTVTFTNHVVRVDSLLARHEDNWVMLSGRLDGYTARAPMQLRIESPRNKHLVIPPAPGYLGSLPPQVREIYHRIRPGGQCELRLDLARSDENARLDLSGRLEIVNGQFIFERFPYPVSRARGRLVFGTDPQTGREQLLIESVRGFGIPGTLNEGAIVEINGKVSPLDHTSGIDIVVSGRNLFADDTLKAAMPPGTRRALRLFDPDGRGEYPKFAGGFVCRVTRTVGEVGQWTTDVEVDVHSGEGRLIALPYPLKDVQAKLVVHDDWIDLQRITMRRGDATIEVDGAVRIDEDGPTDLDNAAMDLNVRVRNLPVDDVLLRSLPENGSKLLSRLGIGGKLDLSGKVGQLAGGQTTYDLTIHLREGQVWPAEGTFAASDATATLRALPGRLSIDELTARRGAAVLSARGVILHPEGRDPTVELSGSAKGLQLDAGLYEALPDNARAAWDRLRPDGALDVAFTYTDAGRADYRIELIPVALQLRPAALPAPLTGVSGRAIITSAAVRLEDVRADLGGSHVRAGGFIRRDDQPSELTLSVGELNVDERLLTQLPEALGKPLADARLRGTISVDLERFRFTEGFAEAEFAGQLRAAGASIDPGIEMTDVTGEARLSGKFVSGALQSLDGQFTFNALSLAGRPVSDLRGRVVRSPGDRRIAVSDLRATLAGGEVAGQAEVIPADAGQGRYALALVVRDADVRVLTGELDPRAEGRLTASFAIEGSFNDIASRRGRGDVVVAGKQLYRMPVMLGLLQMTSLSLPIASPFDRGTASYSLQGSRLNVEAVELLADGMRMNGSGLIDFHERLVAMTFTTDAAGEGARNQLLQIHVRGKLEEPKVGAGVLPTFTTTIDEIRKGN